MRGETRLIRALLAALLALACNAPDARIERLLDADPRLVPAEADGTTRPALRFEGGGEVALDLGDVPLGTLHVSALLTGEEASDERAFIGVAESREGDAPCMVTRRGPAPQWQECSLPVRSAGPVQLAIRIDDPAATLFVSAPWIAPDTPAALPPVFVIVIDTLRADRLHVAETRGSDSAVGRLSRDGIVFESARSPSAWTRSAMATVFTGLAPERHRVHDRFDVLGDAMATLPERLQALGWRTHGWTTNPNVLPIWGFAQGFDRFTDVRGGKWGEPKPDGRRVFDPVRREVEASGGRAHFYYLHVIDPHSPYLPDASYERRVLENAELRDTLPVAKAPAEVTRLYQRYLAEILDLDDQLAAFLEFLDERGLYHDALILVMSDHGEEFLDHGGLFHGKTLFEEMLRVPVILKLPGAARAGTRVATPAGLADLLPTLLDALELEIPDGLDGRSLLREPGDELHVASLHLDGAHLAAAKHARFKLIVDRKGNEALFDLESDPREQRNVIRAHPEEAGRLRRALESRLAAADSGWHVVACGAEEPETLSFSIDGVAGSFAPRRFEAEDRAAPSADGSALEVELDLAPREVLDTRSKRPKLRPVPDRDDLHLDAPDVATLEIRAAGDGPLRVLVGAGRRPRVAALHRIEAAKASAPGSARCDTERRIGPRRPQLRVTYVAPPQRVSRDDVAPELRERLRALGYAD